MSSSQEVIMNEENVRKDHRDIGKQLGLFASSNPVGKGLPLLDEGAASIRRELEAFIFEEEFKRGYVQVNTPALARRSLFETSGHWEFYADHMFPPMDVYGDELVLRPVTCPHHFMLYASRPRSYRELPIRYSEISPLYRKENSGNLYGLVRILEFHLADGHIICREDQLKEEFSSAISLIQHVMSVLGLSDEVSYQLSLHDDSGKFIDDPAGWAFAEKLMAQIMDESKLEYRAVTGEAAFYGPKVDVQILNSQGREETIFTNQIDIAMQKRFDLRYVDEDDSPRLPYVIHRSAVGCLERTIAFLLEQSGGALPLWLAPEQIRILPVSGSSEQYANSINTSLRNNLIRSSVDIGNGRIGQRIHGAGKARVPYIVVVGDRERESEMVSVRNRDSGKQESYPLAEFLAAVENERRLRNAVLGCSV